MLKRILPILGSVIFTVCGQASLKYGVTAVGSVVKNGHVDIIQYLHVYSNKIVLLGIGAYVIGGFLWFYSLSLNELSFAYPFLSLNYILILFISILYFNESVNLIRWLGVSVICLGVIIISRSEKNLGKDE